MTHDPHQAAAFLKPKLKEPPRIAIVLGSGLGSIADQVQATHRFSYAEVPGFPVPKVKGHAGTLVFGRLGGVPVVVMQGRVHLYEGAPAPAIRALIRALKLIGCAGVVLTNAAGSLRPGMGPGSLMLVNDHINFQGTSPMVGDDETFGPRFFPMKDAYDPAWRDGFKAAAARLSIAVQEGVYCAYLGPNFETPAEIRAFRILGADAVGMSTVPEVLVARHCGLKVAAVSVITNMAAGLSDEHLTHEHSLAGTAAAAERLGRLIEATVPAL